MAEDGKKKVFIVEDDKFLLDMYVIKFGEHGFEVATANGGEQALEKLKTEKISPSIMLLDLVMPGMSGFELLESVKTQNLLPDTPMVILSNLGQKEDVDRGMALGADGYIVKASATPSEVVKKVTDIMDKVKKKQ